MPDSRALSFSSAGYPVPNLTWTSVDSDGDRVTMSFTGDLDTDTAQEFSAAVLRTVDAHREPSVRIDLADVDFLAAAGVRALRHCQQYATGQGRRLVVCNPQPSVRHVLEIAAALDLLETAG